MKDRLFSSRSTILSIRKSLNLKGLDRPGKLTDSRKHLFSYDYTIKTCQDVCSLKDRFIRRHKSCCVSHVATILPQVDPVQTILHVAGNKLLSCNILFEMFIRWYMLPKTKFQIRGY